MKLTCSELIAIVIGSFFGFFVLIPVALAVFLLLVAILSPFIVIVAIGLVLYFITWLICKIFGWKNPFDLEITNKED